MKQQDGKPRLFSFTLRDFLIFAAIFICALVLCTLLRRSDISDGFASPVFVLAVLLTSRFTNGYLFGTLAAFLSVIGINYIFTFPYWEFNFTMTGYPLTFFVMLCVSLVTCTMTTKIKQQEQFRMESEREKMRANLLRSVSHDIRTPLTSIIGSTSAILETPDLSLEQQHQLLEDVRDDAQWLVRVVENLLSITRMGEDTRITKQPEAAEEVLGEVARKFRKHYPDVKISVAVPDELLIVPMDAILIEQVMTNLLENAVRHGKNTTHIALSVPPADDRKGAGTAMNIREKILIVEDEKSIAHFISTILNSNDYETLLARSGSEAKTMISSHCPDLVILDLGLPDMDGIDVLRELRSWSSLPVVVVSARSHEHDKVQALDLGADDYLTKPFGTAELLARVRTAIRHTRTTSANSEIAREGTYTVGEMTIDYNKHQVLVRGENVHLTLSEFRIVALLGKFAGKVLTYDYIIKELWGPRAGGDNQILRVNMANIRKIEKNPAEPEYLFTEVGVGYRMAENTDN